jgi:cation diffusion facilitator CzcD-associated flavoprotein CzcO
VFQRSPAYVIPRADKPYRPWQQALFRAMPWTMRLHRAFIYTRYESRALAFTRAKWLLKVAVGLPFRRMLARQVPDAALRARLTPAYPIGCKRILLSSDYLAAFARPNVELVTEGIARVTASGIETADGRVHDADAIIFGTGFAATRFLAPMRVTGRDGLDLESAWRDGAAGYLGMTVPGFPNFFMLYGPNTNLGHNSIIYMLESQFAHVLRCLRALRDGGASRVESRGVAASRLQPAVQVPAGALGLGRLPQLVPGREGRNTVNWPGFSLTYRWLADAMPAWPPTASHGKPTVVRQPRALPEY